MKNYNSFSRLGNNSLLNDLSTKLIELGGYLDKITTNDEE